MDKWYMLALIAVTGLGLAGFLCVVANEIRAVEKTVDLLAAAHEMRKAKEEEEQERIVAA